MIGLLIGLILWIICGILAFGICRGDFMKIEREFPELPLLSPPMPIDLLVFLIGPVGLIVALMAAERPYELVFRWRR